MRFKEGAKGMDLDELNKLDVVDWDCNNGELVYVHIEDTPQNRSILLELGATTEEIKEMVDEQDCELDITTFAIGKLEADWYIHGKGFGKGDIHIAKGSSSFKATLPPENTFACGIVADALEDFLKEWTFEDRSVGIFGCSDAEKSIMEFLITYLRAFTA